MWGQLGQLRPGEKLFEELLADDEHTLPIPHPKLRIVQARSVDAEWLTAALDWLIQDTVVAEAEVKQKLREWVPEYTPKLRWHGWRPKIRFWTTCVDCDESEGVRCRLG